MKRKINLFAFFILMIIIALPSTCCAQSINEDYQNQIEEYDLSSFDLLDDDTSNLLEELGIEDFNYENISSISFKIGRAHV